MSTNWQETNGSTNEEIRFRPAILSSFLPYSVNYKDMEDFVYQLLNDVYVKKIWDAIGLFIAGGLGFGFYSAY